MWKCIHIEKPSRMASGDVDIFYHRPRMLRINDGNFYRCLCMDEKMSVHVDPMQPCPQSKKWPYKYACHLIADSVEELHEFAMQLGLHRSWFQNSISIPHYDLTTRMRREAIRLGAVSVSVKEFIKLMRKYQSRKTSG